VEKVKIGISTLFSLSSHSSLNKGAIFVGHEVGEFDKLVGVSPLVIVPCDKFGKFRAELNGSIGIEA